MIEKLGNLEGFIVDHCIDGRDLEDYEVVHDAEYRMLMEMRQCRIARQYSCCDGHEFVSEYHVVVHVVHHADVQLETPQGTVDAPGSYCSAKRESTFLFSMNQSIRTDE